jgi:lipopolysaccharide/colanic/teichoic acid biosynthesis glycosyltransferase
MILKRLFDLGLACLALLLLSPLLVPVALLIWLGDRGSPFYLGTRVARGGGTFRMVKYRTMIRHADRSGVMSTAGDDARITAVGRLVRRFKIDELPQLLNIAAGQMSFVGPRPNVPTETALYSDQEKRLLTVRPGMTDFASIVFADEGNILEGSADPDRDYNLLIRPWKSRLGLHYIEHRSLGLDLWLIALTALALLSRRRALDLLAKILLRTGAGPEVVRVARREEPLVPALPPGVTPETWEEHLTYRPS